MVSFSHLLGCARLTRGILGGESDRDSLFVIDFQVPADIKRLAIFVMLPRRLFLFVFLFGILVSGIALSAGDAAVPTIHSVQRKVVYVNVPAGYASVTLQQREGRQAKVWRILATQATEREGGLYRLILKRPVTRRGLFVFGTRVEKQPAAPLYSFLADPALQASNGFSGAGGAYPGVVAMNRASTDSVSTSTGSSSGNREVAESDIWRIAGDRLYFFNQLRGLQIFDIADPDAPTLLGQLREPNRGEQMYLLGGDHVALLTRASYYFSLANRPFSLAKNGSAAYDAASGAIVIADVAGGKPGEVARLSYPGYLLESRLVGTALYLVSQVYDDQYRASVVVTSYDLSDPAHPTVTDTLELGSYGSVIAATDRFLFVVRASEDWRRSIIEVVDISAPDGTLVKRGQIPVAGQVPDKFKLNLKGDILTVVSAVPRNWSGDWNAPENLPRTMVETFSLAQPATPVKLGSLELGVGETVHATRFSGDRLYVVTFLTIDPLWVVDLSAPGNPTLLGELEIPGFSTYIEPLGDRLVAIGRLDAQTAVSLFDVSDPAAPALLSQLPLGEGYSYSEANWDEKAFSVFPDHGLILVPYSGYDRASGWASRIQLIDLARDGLTKRGIVDQGFAARRTAVVGDRILAISPSALITVDFADRDQPHVTSDVEIAWSVDRVFLSGDYLVEIGGSADWSRSAPPSITIATPADPDATVTLLELEDVPVTGATVRDGKLYLAQQNAGGYRAILGGGNSPVDANPLILSVYDLSALPAITRIGRTEAEVDPGYGYGAGQLEPAWPNDETLVWVREQWTSWWWYDRPILIGEPIAVSIPGMIALAPTGAMEQANPNLASPVAALTEPAVAPGDGRPLASSSLAVSNDAARLIAPWYRTSVGHEMVVFDVSDAAAPRYTATVDARIGHTGDWSAPIAHEGKLYLSSMAYDGVADPGDGKLSRRYRHFMKRVDFADVNRPLVSEEVNLPGRLLSVSKGGTTLLTLGCAFDRRGLPASARAFHTSRFDGTTATLVDQLRTTTAQDPYALDGGTLFVGAESSDDGEPQPLLAWQIDDERKFVRTGRISTPPFSRFETLNGLLVAFGQGLPCLYDVSDPANLRLLEEADTRELSPGDLGQADGGAGLGIWQAQGRSGVGVVRLK